MTVTAPHRVAVVGSGVAGLCAAYVASRTAQVTLLEADDRLGGHADTHLVPDASSGRVLAIDSGFIVHNRRTYPVLLRLFDELGVPTQESEMSMSTSDEGSGLEWAGALGVRGLFPRLANAGDPRYLRMLAEIPRFHRSARRLLAGSTGGPIGDLTTLGEFLDRGGFTPYFRRHFVEPLVAAVWSCDPAVADQYPAAYLFSFLQHHGMLQVLGSPTWRTVTGGSRAYVERVAAAVVTAGGEVRTGAPVAAVAEVEDGVLVRTAAGTTEQYDALVVATHPDQALRLLAAPTPAQREVLSALPYSRNVALLHTDTRLLPSARAARASWNFRRPLDDRGQVQVTYDLTRLQRLPTDTRYLVTLGGEHLVDPATVIARREYEHPLYSPGSVAARRRLPEIDTDRIAFAGAYHGWGFHEDGARSGLAAVERLGLGWPRPRPRLVTPAAPTTTPATRAVAPDPAATAYATTVTHHRHQPVRRSFRHRSHLWVVDLDRLPDHGRLGWLRGRWEARDHFDGDAPTLRAGLERLLAGHGVDLAGGRALMAAQPRALGHCFNPISVFWAWTAGRDRTAPPDVTVVEVHNTYGGRHAYLLDADDRGRATVVKELYVSPFHGVDGHYRVSAPPPDPVTGRLAVAVSLRTDDGARFDASVVGRPARAPRVAASALRGAALIRLHGIRLWLRGLPVQPRPTVLRPVPPRPVPQREGAR